MPLHSLSLSMTVFDSLWIKEDVLSLYTYNVTGPSCVKNRQIISSSILRHFCVNWIVHLPFCFSITKTQYKKYISHKEILHSFMSTPIFTLVNLIRPTSTAWYDISETFKQDQTLISETFKQDQNKIHIY